MSAPNETEHPEELLDRALHGNLDESQQRALQEHVALCRPCATQLRVAGWMDEDNAGNLALTQMRERTTISRLLATWEATPAPRRWRLARRRFGVAPRGARIGSVILVLSGAAAATAGSWWASHRIAATAPSRPPAIASTRSNETTRTAAHSAVSSATPPEALASAADAPTASEVMPKPLDRATASALFTRASELRLDGQTQAAIVAFKRLQALYPHSRESETSHLVVGRLYLASSRPDLAALEFAHYLQSGGAAQEEALVGHATAVRRLGKPAEEATDWQILLNRFPRSLYAAEAHRRLATLPHPPPEETPRRSGQR